MTGHTVQWVITRPVRQAKAPATLGRDVIDAQSTQPTTTIRKLHSTCSATRKLLLRSSTATWTAPCAAVTRRCCWRSHASASVSADRSCRRHGMRTISQPVGDTVDLMVYGVTDANKRRSAAGEE